MIIAIDGPSGTGKSTVAKGVAKRLGFTFFDTGAMYRCVAWQILKDGIDPRDQRAVAALLPDFIFHIRTGKDAERSYFVGSHDVSKEIRTQHIASIASQIAMYPEVRQTLVKIQRKFGCETDAVFEGRDMGTVVFPKADLKIFLTASSTIRAERRYKELRAKFPDLAREMSMEQIEKEIEERDVNDSTRAVSPLKQAADAILIDTTDLTVEEVIQKIVYLKPKRKNNFAKMKWSYFWVYWIARTFFRVFYGLKIYGLENLKPGSGILAANHVSFFDPPVVSISCPEEVHFLAKDPLFKIPFLGYWIRCLNAHPVAKAASDVQTFRFLIQLLQEGKKVIMFPEGSRSETGEIQPLQRGLSFLVQKTECRIFPVYIAGSYAAWPKQKNWPKFFGSITCVFGSPICWEEFIDLDKKQAQTAILERTHLSWIRLKQWLQAGAHGSPP